MSRAPGVLLVGHPYLISGRGEDVRTAAAAIAGQGMPFHIRNTFDAGQENQARFPNFRYFDRIAREQRYRANLCVLNADEMIPARNHLGTDLFDGGYNIGYWAWELSNFPEAWLPSLDVVDEVWAPSRFIQQAVAAKTSRPVVRMPLIVEPEDVQMERQYFGLPERCFLFLFFFDFSSFIARKNPWAVIDAFRRAFPETSGDEVGLVIKLNGGQLRPEDYQEFLARDEIRRPGIWIIDEVLSDPEIRGLMGCCDAFVSLHRAEGFGRGPAEAMYYGKPVIATGYSGNLDFCNELNACVVDYRLVPVLDGEYPHGDGQIWADADVEQASWYMRKLVAEPDYGARIGACGAETIRMLNSSAAVGQRYAARLRALDLI
ncbi:glycosyltransferase [Thiorhodococcus mannitoliphagus]|nr:glycosyltransferase [Thiorhodococcus mannitoliphagus]